MLMIYAEDETKLGRAECHPPCHYAIKDPFDIYFCHVEPYIGSILAHVRKF